MPMYNYECPKCDHKDWDIRRIAARHDLMVCTKCGTAMERDMSAGSAHVAGDSYAKPIISDSMAVSIDQIEEHKQAFPDVRITDQGQPVMESYSQHEKYLNAVGFVKHPQKRQF